MTLMFCLAVSWPLPINAKLCRSGDELDMNAPL
jgi:hypothetical protein